MVFENKKWNDKKDFLIHTILSYLGDILIFHPVYEWVYVGVQVGMSC